MQINVSGSSLKAAYGKPVCLRAQYRSQDAFPGEGHSIAGLVDRKAFYLVFHFCVLKILSCKEIRNMRLFDLC